MVIEKLLHDVFSVARRYSLELLVALLIIAGRFGLISQETTNIPRVLSFGTVLIIIMIYLVWQQGNATLKQLVKPENLVPSMLICCFTFYGLLSLLWSPSFIYGVDKSLNFFLYVFLGITVLMMANFDPEIFMIISHLVASSVAFAAFAHSFLGGEWAGVKAPGIGFGINTFARLMVYGILINIGLLLSQPFSNRWAKPAYLISLTVLLCVLAASISRGSIIGLSVCLLLAFVFVFNRRQRIAALMYAACVAPLIVLYLWYSGLTNIPWFSGLTNIPFLSNLSTPHDIVGHRFSLLAADDKGASVNVRVFYITESLKYIIGGGFHSVIGYGSGAFPVLVLHADKINYPHNMIVELLLEYGAIGLSMVVGFILYVFKNSMPLLKRQAAYLPKMLFLCFLFSLLTAQVTGDLFDNRFVWWFGVIALLYGNFAGHYSRSGSQNTK